MRFVGPILFFTLLGALWFFNPGPDQFSAFLSEEIAERLGEAGEDAGAMGFLNDRLGRAVTDAAGDAIGRGVAGRFERSNYLLASTYSLDLNGRREGGEWTFLGIAGQFFPLEAPENAETLIRDLVL